MICYSEILENMDTNYFKFIVQVQPNAHANRLDRYENGIVYLKIAAHPVRGKANKEVIAFMSSILNTSKSSLEIVKGEITKKKVLVVKGLNQQEFIQRIEKFISNK